MSIVVDAAREADAYQDFNTTYQKGNATSANPPTWLTGANFAAAGTVETHIPSIGSGVGNAANQWLPALTFVFLTKTAGTRRFA
jgi:hypothetical protein